jgi:hypothetical protein
MDLSEESYHLENVLEDLLVQVTHFKGVAQSRQPCPLPSWFIYSMLTTTFNNSILSTLSFISSIMDPGCHK